MARASEHVGGHSLPFEQPVIELERQIAALERGPNARDFVDEIKNLQASRDSLLQKIYRNLTAWDIVRVDRHPQRPQTSDYIEMMCRDFCELHGDRHFGDDPAIIAGLGRIGPYKVLIVGHQKGRTSQEMIA